MPSDTFFRLPAPKRERLLRCARQEFSRVSYPDASINRIIHSAGIPRGSFYMYFEDKSDLFLYLMDRFVDAFIETVCQLLEEQGCAISRRTVAKYRDELGIPSASGRKQLPGGKEHT